MVIMRNGKQRSVLYCGDIGTPEVAASRHRRTNALHAGKHLVALLDTAASTSSAATDGASSSTAGYQRMVPSYGIELLKHAAMGSSVATLGGDASLEHAESLDPYFKLQGHSSLSVSIAKVASGRHHSLLLLTVGQALLLSPDAAEHATALTLGVTDEATGIQDVAAGNSHFVLCTDLGTVYTFGWSNAYGQLGDGTVWRVDPPPQSAPASERSAWRPILTDPRKVRGFGITVGVEDQLSPMIIAVAAGADHTVLLAASRTAVYTCGRGHCGQLGATPFRKVALSTGFQVIKGLFGTDVAAIAAAGDHTLLLLDTGKLVAFGDNTFGAACTGTTRNAVEPTEAAWHTEEEGGRATTTSAGAAANDCVATTSSRRRPVDSKAMSSIKAPYGSVESYLYPRRLARFPAEVGTHDGVAVPRIASMVTGRQLTVAVTVDQMLYSAGLRLRPDPVTQRADALGQLGRPIQERSDSLKLGPMTLRRCSTAAAGGWHPIVGNGFSAFLDASSGVLRVQGTIAGAFSSLDRKHHASYQSPEDDSVALNVGANRKVVAAVAVKHGLLLVVEDVEG